MSSEPTMRAVVQDSLGGPEVLRLADLPRPRPLPTEVLVRVRAAGVNPVDWKSRESGGIAGLLGEPPFVLGWDVSGVVEEVGFGVHTLKVGDEVYGMPWFPRPASAYAEYVTAPSRQFALKPRTIDHAAAAAVPLAGLTAWQALVDAAGVEAGRRVLIHAAAGGVGHLAVQFAKHLGAHVIGTASAAKHDWLRELGADEVVDYTRVRFEEAVSDVDVVIDLVGEGHDATTTRSLETLRPGGTIVAVPSGVAPEVLAGARARGLNATAFLVEPDGASLARIAALIDAGTVRVGVEDVLPLAEAAEAHRRVQEGRTRGKIVLSVTD
ncbi:NADP-dependent oxidoreductase [Streptomyces sp. NBC_01498]|uniref:NADP-dependent oxidoreductase n=1 Tax=Streptomyces sp. NBC_01498 TaxID=2975870 RepID=UPI002E7B6BCF|nr:NADP-dependent oxidoreductase [Streptomyces sp. NBC_01498]WTL28117.1 NADP-dependent oxidoreductase [Streptomyces sp. NBC_01498]